MKIKLPSLKRRPSGEAEPQEPPTTEREVLRLTLAFKRGQISKEELNEAILRLPSSRKPIEAPDFVPLHGAQDKSIIQ